MIINSWDINKELKLCHVDRFDNSINDLVRKYFDHNYPILRWREYLTNDEAKSVSKLHHKLRSRQTIDVGVFKGDQIVAWSYGWQGGMETASYYMANSCVIPEYRRQGLYSLMLNKVVEVSKELGFHTLTSRHVASNNNVIIPKLKAGFKITGMELSEIHGNLVHLTYFNNELREEAFDVRSGLKKPTSESLKKIFE